MKYFLVFRHFLKFLCIFAFVSCTSKSSSPAKAPPPGLSYNFLLENCSTGLHNYKDNSSENQRAYCADLAKDDINNFCAHEERLALIRRDCSAGEQENPQIVSPSAENSDKNLLSLRASTQKYGLPYDNMEIKFLGRPDLSALVHMQHFWVTNFGDFSFRFQDERSRPPNTDTVIQDFIDCGFSYDGPTCYEGEERNIQSQEMVAINGETYLITVFNYSVSYNHLFALIIETHPKQSLTHAYLYSLGDASSLPSPAAIVRESAAKCLASISAIPFSANAVDQILEDATSTRQKLTLTHIKMSFPQYRESILSSAAINSSIEEIVAKTSQEIEESNDPGLAVLWLKLHAGILSNTDYQRFLATQQRDNPTTARATEAALLQASLGIITPDIEKYYARALNTDNLGEQARAFNLARQRIGLSDKILLSLINTLNHPNVHSAAIAYDILASQPLNDAYVEPLSKLSGKLGNNGSAYVFAYDLLKKINTPLAQNAIIAQLSHRDRNIRDKVYQTVDDILYPADELKFSDSSTHEAAKQMESFNEKSRLYAIQILDQINSPEATLTLIEFSDQDIFYLRSFINDKVLIKPDKIFTHLHLEALTRNLDPKYPDQVLDPTIKYLFRLGTPEALNAVLKYINRAKNIFIDDEFRRQWMLEYLAHAKISGENAHELGRGIGAKYKDLENAFLTHLLQLRHHKSTDVLLEKLRTHPKEMLPNFDEVFSELKNRAESDLNGLFGGEAGLNLGNLFMKSRFELKKFGESPDNSDPNTASLINYYEENLAFSMNNLLPLRTISALKSLVTLMGIDDEALRHEIIAAVLDFDDMPREIWESFYFHVKNREPKCNIDKPPCQDIPPEKEEFLNPSLSLYPETRAAAFARLAWLFRYTKDERTDDEIKHHYDNILFGLRSNISPQSLLTNENIDKNFIPLVYEETFPFFKNVIEEEGPNLNEQFRISYLVGSAVPQGNCKKLPLTRIDASPFYLRNLELVEMLPPFPEIIDKFDELYERCPTFAAEYPELDEAIKNLLERLR